VKSNQILAISTSMLAFTGFVLGMFTIVYYLYQIKDTTSPISVILWVNVYILINLLFLYLVKREVRK